MPTATEFNQLVTPHRENIYGAAMRLARNPDVADDLVQDTMIRAFRFLDTYKRGTNIKAWLFTILRNTFINGYHKAGRRSTCQREVQSNMAALGVEVSVGAMAGQTEFSAEELVDIGSIPAAIRDALAEVYEIAPDYALAVELCDLEDLSYKEIAELMGCPVGTVMSRIYRGRKMLRKKLADQARAMGVTVKVESDTPVTEPRRRAPRHQELLREEDQVCRPRCPSGWNAVQLSLEIAA
jgi:RNA polymerase sigma-70 factor (ECF subfamily)